MGIKSLVASRLSRVSGGLVLFLLLAVAGYSWVQTSLKNSRIATTNSRLTRIGLALRNYHDEYRTFPPAVMLGPGDVPWHGWRVPLLPYLGEQELADKYRMDEPWDSSTNRLLVERCPEVFQLPTSNVRPGCANACAVIGKQTAWPAQQRMRMRDFKRGMTNSIFVVEASSRREWTNPRDMIPGEFMRTHYAKGEEQIRSVLMGDGNVRRIDPKIDRKILATLLTSQGRKAVFRGDYWPAMFKDSRTVVASKIVDSTTLEKTSFHASWNEPLDGNGNSLWCAVFQMCWDNLAGTTGGPVKTYRTNPLVDQLNATPFDRANIHPDSYMLEKVSADSKSTAALVERIEKKFPDANPQFEVIDDAPSLRLYGCLEKSIQFPEELSALEPLAFNRRVVRSFVESFGKKSDGTELGDPVFTETVFVGDYISDEDFIVVLRTDGGQKDQIILAKVQPEATLGECWSTVQSRLKKPHRNRVLPQLYDGESLQVPILDLNIKHQFSPLIGVSVSNIPNYPFSPIVEASETIRFRLDQYGVDLLAQAEILILLGSMGDEPEFDPEKPRHFVFDQPFLLVLREKSATQPYLLCWVAHPDIMVPASPSSGVGD